MHEVEKDKSSTVHFRYKEHWYNKILFKKQQFSLSQS